MARSDKVQFRREFTLTSNGYAGNSDGFFVGDILSLHVDILNGNISYLIEGKVGREGEWRTIKSGSNERYIENIDIRAFEYVRVEISKITSSTKIILFGYENNIVQESIISKLEGNELQFALESRDNLEQIVEELKKLNTYMSIITGEDL
jgi:hypothetical protein